MTRPELGHVACFHQYLLGRGEDCQGLSSPDLWVKERKAVDDE